MAYSSSLDEALVRFRQAGDLLHSRLTSSPQVRDQLLRAYDAQKHLVERQFDRVPTDLDELVLRILPECFELVILHGSDPGTLEALFNDLIAVYQLDLSDLSYYRRDRDPISFYQDFGLTEIDALKPEVARKLCHAFVESHILTGRVERFREDLVRFRRSLTPQMLMQSVFRLVSGLQVHPDSSILSVIFGATVESFVPEEKKRKVGYLSLDTYLKQFLQEQDLELDAAGVISLLDQFFHTFSQQDPNWLFRLIKAHGRKNASAPTGNLFNYEWAEGIAVPEGSFLASLRVDYPEDSYSNIISLIAREINLNREVRSFTRECLGLPKVGEGKWVTELSVLQFVKSCVSLSVMHQWSPEWLRPQRIDVGIPNLKLAFEYQGKQHYEPIDFFGGEEAFQSLQKRDAKKRRLCLENGIKLVELDYRLSESAWRGRVRDEIEKAQKQEGIT